MEVNKCECGKIIPLKDKCCAECSEELDSWFEDLFDGIIEDIQKDT